MDIKLDGTWDLEFDENEDLIMIGGIAETSQASRFRLQLVRGECFEDTNLGMPWLTDMVDPKVSIDTKKQIISRTILSSPGAISLTSLTIVTDTQGRLAISEFKGLANEGEFSG